MIDNSTYTKEHIIYLSKKLKLDPQLVERTIFALGLLETLAITTKDFVFKGGSSLLILLKNPRRISTDIDIVIKSDFDIEEEVLKVSKKYPFIFYEESKRKTSKSISKKHYRIFYKSLLMEEKISYVLLDVLFSSQLYTLTINTPIQSEFLITKNPCIYVKTPTIEAILGDKLTAFAPHTVGIKFQSDEFSNDKRLEVIKQLLDISSLYDLSFNFNSIKNNYISICKQEIKYRDLNISYKDCLLDSFATALSIFSRGAYNKKDYPFLLEGINKVVNHVYKERYSSEKAVDDASKVILLVAGILTNTDIFKVKIEEQGLITNPKYNRINFQKKTHVESFNRCVFALNLFNKIWNK